jgi:sarcosine oxidase gamma subunit
MATTDPVAVRIARDRCLLVSSEPLALPFGWQDGWAASPAGSAWLAAELAGPAMRAVLCEGTAVDLDGGSRSASLLFAGVPALLYRSAEDRARLHVETGFGPYLWRWLEDRRG